MYLMPEDGQYGRNLQHILRVLITFVVADGNTHIDLNIHLNKPTYTSSVKSNRGRIHDRVLY